MRQHPHAEIFWIPKSLWLNNFSLTRSKWFFMSQETITSRVLFRGSRIKWNNYQVLWGFYYEKVFRLICFWERLLKPWKIKVLWVLHNSVISSPNLWGNPCDIVRKQLKKFRCKSNEIIEKLALKRLKAWRLFNKEEWRYHRESKSNFMLKANLSASNALQVSIFIENVRSTFRFSSLSST